MSRGRMTRRRFLQASAGGMLSVALRARAAGAGGGAMASRPIPRSGELLPVVGLGTWQTFDVGASAEERRPLAEVMRLFLQGGGRVVDSSPMYGRAEAVAGDLAAAASPATPPFLATKVWTTGKASGEAQMRESMRRLRTDRVDLMQVHNLLDWETHLPVLRAWKEQGRIRYLGITHYAQSSFPLLEKLVQTKWQAFWRNSLGEFYGGMLHEGLYKAFDGFPAQAPPMAILSARAMTVDMSFSLERHSFTSPIRSASFPSKWSPVYK